MVPSWQAKLKKLGNSMIPARHSLRLRPWEEAAKALNGLDMQAAPSSVPLCLKHSSSRSLHRFVSRIPAPQVSTGARYRAKPSGVQWKGLDLLAEKVSSFLSVLCEQMWEVSRSNCGCSAPNWLCPFNYKETSEHCIFPPAELWKGKNKKFLGTEGWH